MSEPGQYVLGTGESEVERLGLQHQWWRAELFSAVRRAGFGQGQRLLDVGCGPGYTSRDLAELVGPSGQVTAVDLSPSFVQHLEAMARELPQLEGRCADVQDMEFPPSSFDGAYARWVFWALPEPEAALAGVAAALRPGGVLVVQDYIEFRTVSLAPRSAAFDRFARAVDESWRAVGGDPEILKRLQHWLPRYGLRLRELRPVVRVVRPSDPLWGWPLAFARNYAPLLVERGLLSSAARDELWEDLERYGKDPDALFVTPLLGDLIAEKSVVPG